MAWFSEARTCASRLNRARRSVIEREEVGKNLERDVAIAVSYRGRDTPLPCRPRQSARGLHRHPGERQARATSSCCGLYGPGERRLDSLAEARQGVSSRAKAEVWCTSTFALGATADNLRPSSKSSLACQPKLALVSGERRLAEAPGSRTQPARFYAGSDRF